ncbi:MAG: hypothetical protein FD159_1512 [Syntrophaceae bacterium]|nr:MAG: hypothetical protein FD159_1512 [Syntrophaceae bacterium]
MFQDGRSEHDMEKNQASRGSLAQDRCGIYWTNQDR